MSPVAKSRTSAPASPASAFAGDAERHLLEALARHYAGAEFTARAAAANLAPALWQVGGVAGPDPAAVGRWLRVRKGVVAGYVLANRKNRDGVALWRVRPVEPRQAAPAVPRDPASLPPPSPETVPPKPPPLPLATPWWAVPASSPSPAAGGAAERPRGASWWAPEPKVLLIQLSERTSAKGTRYLSGFLGRAKLVAFLDQEPDRFGNPRWSVYASEPAPRVDQAAGDRAGAPRSEFLYTDGARAPAREGRR